MSSGLNEKYIEGTVDYIDKFYPGLSSDIYDAQSKVHESAKDYTEGSISIKKFKSVLDTWYNLHLKSIEIYGNTLIKKK